MIANLLGGDGIWFSLDFASRISILVRLYGAHGVIMAGLILVLFMLHALLVKRQRISPRTQVSPRVTTPSKPPLVNPHPLLVNPQVDVPGRREGLGARGGQPRRRALTPPDTRSGSVMKVL